MKKVVFGALFLALIGTTLTFTSCEKTNFTANVDTQKTRSTINNHFGLTGKFLGYEVKDLKISKI